MHYLLRTIQIIIGAHRRQILFLSYYDNNLIEIELAILEKVMDVGLLLIVNGKVNNWTFPKKFMILGVLIINFGEKFILLKGSVTFFFFFFLRETYHVKKIKNKKNHSIIT